VWELDEDMIRRVIDIDFTGTILTAAIAAKKMLEQGHGHIYNMEGFGSNGRLRGGLTVYGATKRALRFWSRSLAKEVSGTGVKVSRISPGIVITDFLTEQYQDDPEGLEQGKKIFNILGDKVETVTPWLVQKMIGNKKNDALFEWLTLPKLLGRFLTAGIRKRQLM
jgi:short-subunit dehydrogenase